MNAPPIVHKTGPGICIHGHFNRTREIGIGNYYPDADQFVAIIRDPLERAISYYFFWKAKHRQKLIDIGTLKEDDILDYKNITDYFNKRPHTNILNFFPAGMTKTNYKQFLKKHFIYIGIAEDLDTSIRRMAERLGFPEPEIGHINASERNEEIPAKVKETFIKNNPFEYEFYNYVLKIYKKRRGLFPVTLPLITRLSKK